MPRCPAKDYADRCRAVELHQQGMKRTDIAATLHRPARWVHRTLALYDPQIGLESLKDRSSRPLRAPNRTPPHIEEAICEMKRAHLHWGRRQITRQLRWRWRPEPSCLSWISEGRVRRVLARHPELSPPAPKQETSPHRQIDYLECNILWAADIHHTNLPDGSHWETLHWIDLYSRYELGQVTAPHLTEEMVTQSMLDVMAEYGLPLVLKTDRDKLFHDATSGLPTLPSRVLAALVVVHALIPKKQPWWNGVVERHIRTCRQEAHLPSHGDPEQVHQAMEAVRNFCNQERCHSRCQDQPPATCYHPSSRRLPPDFDLGQLPITLEPTVVTRQVQASGRVSLAGCTYPFSRNYAGQTVTVTIDGWSATAKAQDGWQRTWDLRSDAPQASPGPLPPHSPQPLTRKVNARGCITLNRYLYYVGIAWVRQTVTVQPQRDSWEMSLPDGSTKTAPQKHLFPQPAQSHRPARLDLPPLQRPDHTVLQQRRVTRTGQIAFYHRLYYVGIAHRGETVRVAPTSQGLSIYNAELAWITTCCWKQPQGLDEPLCPT